jgi:hypothetical protein
MPFISPDGIEWTACGQDDYSDLLADETAHVLVAVRMHYGAMQVPISLIRDPDFDDWLLKLDKAAFVILPKNLFGTNPTEMP